MKARLRRCLAATSLALAASGPAAAASGAVEIRYRLSIAGLPIGTASLDAAIRDDGYTVKAAARIGGILALLSDGRGAATASGRIGQDRPVAAGYALNSVSSDKKQTVQMALSGGTIVKLDVNPPVPFREDRVPVEDAHKHGVFDPLSALLMPVNGSGPTVTAQACNRTLPVFDGAQRFDVALTYDRMEPVEARNSYTGEAVVCTARYKPISGHRAKREQTRFMAENRDLEVWLAPIEGTRVLAPWRIVIGTQIGRLTIDASRFTEQPGPRDPAEASAN